MEQHETTKGECIHASLKLKKKLEVPKGSHCWGLREDRNPSARLPSPFLVSSRMSQLGQGCHSPQHEQRPGAHPEETGHVCYGGR